MPRGRRCGHRGKFPADLGAGSYNAGAGLADVAKLAKWVKGNMPLCHLLLSEGEAFEVARLFDSHPRIDFVLNLHLRPGSAADD